MISKWSFHTEDWRYVAEISALPSQEHITFKSIKTKQFFCIFAQQIQPWLE